MFLPIFTGPVAPPDGMVNPFWASVFGLGFWIEYSLVGFPSFGIWALVWGVIGFILWPVAVLWLFARLVRGIQRSRSRVVRILLYAGLLPTLLYNVPISSVQGSFVNYLPIFIRYLDAGPR
jgi:hypothetical protein